MGQVYKARDTKLDRTVAVKILPPDLLKNDERVRRFIQEAKSASSLNHPHIVTIHEIGQADMNGDETPVHYIAMELVDGTTLRRQIHDKDTDLRTLVGYLAQAAEGLAKAHEAGIVHRDLKPENIMVTRDGYAKVLDFGLAKLTQKKSADGATSETAVRQDTREGAILGTVGYMAPEQVKGKAVDHRADIFSLGCILYEAATRRRPFEADSDVDVLHKIMHDKPVPIDELNPQAPAELRRIIRRCMAKEPEKRYQSMKDVALELSDIVDEYDDLSASATSGSGSVASAVAAVAERRRTGMMAAAFGVFALAAIAFAIFQWRAAHTNAGKRASSFGSMRIKQMTSTGNVLSDAISPDGKYLAQVLRNADGKWTMSMRSVATGSDVVLVPSASTPIRYLAFSKDGNYLYYSQSEEQTGSGYAALFQIPALGGAPRKVAFDVDTIPSFSPDGTKMAFGRGFPPESKNVLIIANADGSNPHELFRSERLGAPPTPAHWSLDGKKIITTMRSLQGGLHAEVIEVDVATGKVIAIGANKWRRVLDTAMLGDGSAIVLATIAIDSGNRPQLWLQPYPDGDPVRVTNDANAYETASVTADGTALASTMVTGNGDLVTCAGTDESCKPLTGGTADQLPFEVGVAATGAVVYDFDRGEGPDIAIVDAPGAAPRMLTNDHQSSRPTISADGKTIAFQSRRVGNVPAVFVMDVDGGGVRKLFDGARPQVSPDGKTIIANGSQGDLLRGASAGGAPAKVADRTNGTCAIDAQSQRLAYAYWKIENGKNVLRVAVTPLAGGSPLIDMPFTSTRLMRFTPGGDGILYWRSLSGADNIYMQPLTGGEPKQLTHFRTGEIQSFDVETDGKLVMTRGVRRADLVLITNFR